MFERMEYPKKKESQIQRLIESQMGANPRLGGLSKNSSHRQVVQDHLDKINLTSEEQLVCLNSTTNDD